MRRIFELLVVFALGFVVAQVGFDRAGADEAASRPGYMIVMGKNYAPEDLQPYGRALPTIYEKYQGGYVALTTSVEVLEGEYPYQSIILSKWPSIQNARDFWASPEYAEAIKLREGIGEFDVITFEGLPETPPQ